MTDRTLALLEEVADFLDGYVDVKDGSDGVPQPNEAMLLKGDVDGEIARIKRSAGPGDGHWTKVKDGGFPPKSDKRYLVTNGNLWRIAWFHDCGGQYKFWDCIGSAITVTHWTDLPELPSIATTLPLTREQA